MTEKKTRDMLMKGMQNSIEEVKILNNIFASSNKRNILRCKEKQVEQRKTHRAIENRTSHETQHGK